VTAVSNGKGKADEAKKLGAETVLDSSSAEEMGKSGSSYYVVLNTT